MRGKCICRKHICTASKYRQAVVAPEEEPALHPLLRIFALPADRRLSATTSKFVASGVAEA
jgi:hypothetical protein